MKKWLQSFMTAGVAAIAAFGATNTTGCDPVDDTQDTSLKGCQKDPLGAACVCKKSKGVVGDEFACSDRANQYACVVGKCLKKCSQATDCTRAGDVCEDAICRPAGCGTDAQCSAGESCIAGSCKSAIAASTVTSCKILPANAVLHQGSSDNFRIVAFSGATAIPYLGAATWSTDGATKVDVAGATMVAASVKGGSENGAAQLKAKVGSIDCSPASVINYKTVDAGKVRLVAVSLADNKPIANAKGLIGTTEVTTDANGMAEISSTDAKNDFHVFPADYAYGSVFQTTSKDVVLYLKAAPKTGKFNGTMTPRAFDALADFNGTANLAIYAAALTQNPLDIQLSAVLGDFEPTNIEISSAQKFNVGLPKGLIIGLGEKMFRENYEVLAPVGTRTLWGIGGKVALDQITPLLSSVSSGGGASDLPIGSILTAVLPLLSRLQSGALTGVEASATASKNITDDMKLSTLMRLNARIKLPELPSVMVDGKSVKYEAAVTVVGTLVTGQGLAPLGLSAGIDAVGGPKDASGKDTGNGKIDPGSSTGLEGSIDMRFAPRHSGLEGNKLILLTIAGAFSNLLSGASTTTTARDSIVLSGKIKVLDGINYSTTPQEQDQSTPFMAPPQSPTVAGRGITMTSNAVGATFQRFDIGGNEKGWVVYTPGDLKNITLPATPTGLEDRFLTPSTAPTTGFPSVLFHSMKLSMSYDDLVKFDGIDVDDFMEKADAFSTYEIQRKN